MCTYKGKRTQENKFFRHDQAIIFNRFFLNDSTISWKSGEEIAIAMSCTQKKISIMVT